MATSGQTINDRINAARYALAGQGLARCVCKATTEEVIGPKKKHLEYLIACTHEPNVSIPQLANLLIERTNHIQWVVVFKALVTVHQLMSYGNERFIQYLASSNYSFELSTFLDKTSGRDFSMSTFIRRYSRYINEKAISYRKSAFDFCKIKRGNEGVLRTMPIDRLLKTLPILQDQLDALLDFDCTASDLNNGVINACFMLLFRDLIGLFACHNDGIINLLNRYFTLNKKMCREAFDLYKKFLVRMDKVSEFLRVAEVVGIDKDEIPDLRRAPSSLIDALEQHLQNLESNKKILKQAGSGNNTDGSKSTNEQLVGNLSLTGGGSSTNANNNMSSNNSSGTNDDLSALGGGPTSFKDDEVRRALEEEARVLSLYGSSEAHNKSTSRTSPGQLKTNASKRNSTTSSTGADNGGDSLKFAVSTAPKTIDDIFGDSNSFATATNNNDHATSKNSCLDGSAGPKHQRHQQRPDFDLIKTAIQSATTTLEKANVGGDNNHSANHSSAKASDDLFGLLDTSSAQATTVSNLPTPASTTNMAGPIGHQQQSANPMSPFATSATLTPFDLPLNGQSGASNNNQFNTATSMKPGNPFPEVAAAPSFPASFETGATLAAQPAASNQAAAFKSTTTSMSHQPTGANYTSLGGLEGFGDVLQPTFAAGNRSSYMNQTHGGANSSGGRSAFTSSGGLSSTGLFKGDLDSTLANLAQNLTFEGMSKPKK